MQGPLISMQRVDWEGRRHFFAAAAETMRHILIDRARRKKRHRHGGGWERVELDAVEVPAIADEDILIALDEALTEFQRLDPARAEIVKLRYFVGLSGRETAELLSVSERTIERHWAYAKAWLFDRIRPASPP